MREPGQGDLVDVDRQWIDRGLRADPQLRPESRPVDLLAPLVFRQLHLEDGGPQRRTWDWPDRAAWVGVLPPR